MPGDSLRYAFLSDHHWALSKTAPYADLRSCGPRNFNVYQMSLKLIKDMNDRDKWWKTSRHSTKKCFYERMPTGMALSVRLCYGHSKHMQLSASDESALSECFAFPSAVTGNCLLNGSSRGISWVKAHPNSAPDSLEMKDTLLGWKCGSAAFVSRCHREKTCSAQIFMTDDHKTQ